MAFESGDSASVKSTFGAGFGGSLRRMHDEAAKSGQNWSALAAAGRMVVWRTNAEEEPLGYD